MARECTPEAARIYTPSFARRAASETRQPANAAAAYQAAVFNFLFGKKDALGINEVWMCRNVRIDGLLELEEFNEDWARRSPLRRLENGWNYWYTDHQYVGGLRVHLVRFRDGTLESFDDALGAARVGAAVS